MDLKTTLSAKGQVVIPKTLREAMGLHQGSELLIHLRSDSTLEFKPVKKNLSDFFGMGARKSVKKPPLDVDQAIAEAILENNLFPKKEPQ